MVSSSACGNLKLSKLPRKVARVARDFHVFPEDCGISLKKSIGEERRAFMALIIKADEIIMFRVIRLYRTMTNSIMLACMYP